LTVKTWVSLDEEVDALLITDVLEEFELDELEIGVELVKFETIDALELLEELSLLEEVTLLEDVVIEVDGLLEDELGAIELLLLHDARTSRVSMRKCSFFILL
jgi:hypothetical protein